MTTMSLTTDAGTSPGPDRAEAARHRKGSGVSARGVLRSEWVKLRSVRSNVITLGAAGALLFLIGVIFAGILGGVFSTGEGDISSEFAANPAGATLQGTLLAQLVIGVLGVLVITSEYSTGMIRSTLTAVPARLPVLGAKAVVVAVATFPVMLLAGFAAFFLGQVLIGSGDLATASLTDPGVLRAVVGTAGYLTGIALMGLAFGTLLRSTPAAISTLFGLVFLLPGLGGLLLPASWRDDVLKFLPGNAGSAFTEVLPVPGLLSSGAGLAVFAAWVVVPLALAALAFKRRNV